MIKHHFLSLWMLMITCDIPPYIHAIVLELCVIPHCSLPPQQINSAITSAADLKGKAVASTAIYLPRLRLRYGIAATDEKVQGDDTLEAIANNVVNGQFAAFIWCVCVAPWGL